MRTKKNVKKFSFILIMLALWFLLVLYPNPRHLAASVYRLKNPPLMPIHVTEIARQLQGNSPDEIQAFVYNQLPYRYDWEVYNMPWYFPTLEEAMQNGKGDCKARYLLFASLMEELDMPYYKNISLTHIWVGYEGKQESALENINESMVVVDGNGQVRLTMPRPDLRRSGQSFYRGFWEVMPASKKYLLAAGFPFTFGFFFLCQLTYPLLPTKKK